MKRFIVWLLLIPSIVNATASLGDVSHNMLVPVSGVAHVGYKIALILGVGCLVMTIVRYIEHRRNPNFIPLSHVFWLLLAGLILVFFPLAIEKTKGGQIVGNPATNPDWM